VAMIPADWEGSMKKKTFTEQELLAGLDAESAHADELATLLPQELTPLGSGLKVRSYAMSGHVTPSGMKILTQTRGLAMTLWRIESSCEQRGDFYLG